MFSELFGMDNYGAFNIKMANTFGLEAAVYLNELLNLSYNNDFIELDRKHIKEVTTLEIETQRTIDNLFSKLKLVDIRDRDSIKFNYDIYLGLFGDFNSSTIDWFQVKPKKRTKSEAIKDELRKLIRSDNGELRDAYSDWIDSVFAKQGWMSKKSVDLGQKLIDEYSNHDLDIALNIINIASIGGYRDMQWAINSYEENKKNVKRTTQSTSYVPRDSVQLSQEVF